MIGCSEPLIFFRRRSTFRRSIEVQSTRRRLSSQLSAHQRLITDVVYADWYVCLVRSGKVLCCATLFDIIFARMWVIFEGRSLLLPASIDAWRLSNAATISTRWSILPKLPIWLVVLLLHIAYQAITDSTTGRCIIWFRNGNIRISTYLSSAWDAASDGRTQSFGSDR